MRLFHLKSKYMTNYCKFLFKIIIKFKHICFSSLIVKAWCKPSEAGRLEPTISGLRQAPPGHLYYIFNILCQFADLNIPKLTSNNNVLYCV